ncbi:MAG: fibronectin type III domain-containing protein [Deltaproteobacteria bacterium]|nr:fibronectin type III domain-containing protein [Deltaproteobacteria bacterium]
MSAFCIVSSKAATLVRPYLVISSFITLLYILLILPSICPAAQVTLAWDLNHEPTVSGYRVYYGTTSSYYTAVIDVGSQTTVTITGLVPGVTYFISATAYASTGDESNFSGEIAYTVPGSSPSSSGGGGGCFIATAAFGSYLAPEVAILRAFRDEVLMTNSPGRAFVEWYYRVSPPIAAFIAEHALVKTAARWGLRPIVYAVKHPLAVFAIVVAIPAAVIARKRRAASRQ